jgi:hypothetical protein
MSTSTNKSPEKKRKSEAGVEAQGQGTGVVYLPSQQPPRLSTGTSIYGFIGFVEQFSHYTRTGGSASLTNCIDASFLDDLQLIEQFDVRNELDLKKVLHKKYCPSDSTITLDVLRREKCPPCDSMATFEVDKYMRYVRTYVQIMVICSEKCPSNKECMKVLLRNTQPKELANFMRGKGLEDLQGDSLLNAISTAVRAFDAANALIRANRGSKPPPKSTGGWGSHGGNGGSHGGNGGQRPPKPAVVSVVQSTPSTAATSTPAANAPSKRWAKEMCLGCGHIN